MWNPIPTWRPSSSYDEPVAPVGSEPDAEPLVCVQVSKAWVPYIVGSLMQLAQPTTWATTDATVLQTCLDQVTALIEMFGTAEGCVAPQFRFTEACVLQYSTDGGETWVDTTDWSTFAPTCFTGPPGADGTNGTNGTDGVTPQLRWNGCTFQVSTDGGSTWGDLSGFDITTLQGCLGGTPTTPTGVSTAQNACNIASWLAVQLLQGSMSSLAASIGATATVLETGVALFGLAASWSGVGTIVFGAIDGFIAVGTAIGETALNTAAGDSGLRGDLLCAIYEAIYLDGHVTSSNFSSILANINAISYGTPGIVGLLHDYVSDLGFAGVNAIQAEGTLADGDCSACANPPTWCFEWDLTAGLGPWVLYNGSGNDGHWVSGTGVVADVDGGKWEIDLAWTFPTPHTITSLQVEFLSPTANAGTNSFTRLGIGASFYPDDQYAQGASGSVQTRTTNATNNPIAYVVLRLASSTSGAACVMKKIRIRGTGTNPFGTTNCT